MMSWTICIIKIMRQTKESGEYQEKEHAGWVRNDIIGLDVLFSFFLYLLCLTLAREDWIQTEPGQRYMTHTWCK